MHVPDTMCRHIFCSDYFSYPRTTTFPHGIALFFLKLLSKGTYFVQERNIISMFLISVSDPDPHFFRPLDPDPDPQVNKDS